MNLTITPVDKKSELDGAWGSYRGVDLLIARANNTHFRKVFRRLSKPFSREIEKGSISEDDSENILCGAMADAILVSWENFEMSGATVEYTKDNAKALLVNDPDCRKYVQEFSEDIDNYLKEETEKTAGE